ncbi:MAG: beta-phosphoglucomutase [Lentisphaerae bacterium GWF2_52_8]|nr:MAG: beta-phosphoglucomutase [Lentisphaerae bacterium GWF2_52_8]
MKHQIKAALFDLDGVLVLTDRYHFRAWLRLAREMGWAFDERVSDRCRGIPRMASLQVILEHNKLSLPEETMQKLASRKNSYYLALIEELSPADIYPGAADFLRKLKEENIRLAVCSSSENAKNVLEKLNLSKFFDASVSGGEISRPKPDPQIFLLAAAKLGFAPCECVVFEDASAGIAAARSAGMSCIGIGDKNQLPDAPETITNYDDINLAELLSEGLPFKT